MCMQRFQHAMSIGENIYSSTGDSNSVCTYICMCVRMYAADLSGVICEGEISSPMYIRTYHGVGRLYK